MLWLSIFLLGVTAGLCPLNLAMVTPYIPSLAKSKGKVSSAILFSVGMSVVFTPLGILMGFLGGVVLFEYGLWLSLLGGAVILVVGLWTLRVIHLHLPNVRLYKVSGGLFIFGVAYALATIGRGAPMLMSTLSLVALEGNLFVGGLALIVYSFCLGMPLTLIALVMKALNTERKEAIFRRSKTLERFTGVLLVIVGAYYIFIVVNALMAL